MRRYLNKAVAAIIAAAMIMTSAGSVYADDVVSSSQDSDSVVSEVESADQNISDEADDTDTEEMVSDGEVQAESTVTEGTEEVTPAEDETSGACGENLTWNYDEASATLTISGTGAMQDYSSYDSSNYSPWYSFKSGISNIIVTEGVTSLGYNAFANCSNLSSITLPESLTNIGEGAFCYCGSLEHINLPENLLSIGDSAFYYCTDLQSIEFPEHITSIGYGAFEFCIDLTTVNFSESITSIGDYAFKDCTSLTSIELPEGITEIGDYTFDDCSGLTNIDLPESITSIGNHAFAYNNNMTTIDLPDNLISIGDYAFSQWYSLANVFLPDSVTSIGDGVFYDCNDLKVIGIPNGITSIKTNAFYNCYYLSNVYYAGTKEQWRAIEVKDGNTYLSSASVMYNASYTTDGTLTSASGECGENVTWSYDRNNSTLTISGNGEMSDFEMYGTSNLSPWRTLCGQIVTVLIEDGVTSIGEAAFYTSSFEESNSLTTINIPNTVTRIGANAFNGCKCLTSIELPEGITEISEDTFMGCRSLTSLHLPEGITDIGEFAFASCSNLANVNLPGGITKLSKGIFSSCDSLTYLDLPEGITEIGDMAFASCDGLTSIDLPKGVTEIGWQTFAHCTGLTNIDLPEGITEIDSGAFEYCSSLIDINLPAGITEIGEYAFKDCSSLTTINLPDGLEKIVYGAFSGCSSLKTINLPESITNIYSDAFENCSILENITIPSGIYIINSGTFSGCSNLESVTIPKNVRMISDDAFSNCTSLTNIYYTGTEDKWNSVSIESGNENITSATVNYIEGEDIETTILNGTYRDNLTWSLNLNDRVLTISGTGEMGARDSETIPWYSYQPLINSVVIEKGVTTICSGAFEFCNKLTNVNLPEGLTSIGNYAFWSCGSLSNIVIPTSLTNIGYYAFSGCDVLADIYYAGSEEQWNAIEIAESGNDSLSSANIHYNTTPVAKPQITSQPINATTALKAKATFSVSAENVVSYQWQYSKNNGSSWSNLKDSSATSSFISGTTTDTLTILTTNTRCGYVYRCQLTGENGDAIYTDTVTLSKIPELSITTQPVDTVGSLTKRTTFTVVAENAASYQWQYSKNSGTSWNTLKDSASSSTYIGGCTTDTLTLLVNSTRSGYVYRCKVTGQDGTVKYTDQAAILLFTITSQPESVQAKSGNTVTFSVGAENAESYQWYYQKEGSTTWNKLSDNTKSSMLISGSTSDTLTIKMTKTRLTFKYRCKVKGQDGTSKYTDTVEVMS